MCQVRWLPFLRRADARLVLRGSGVDTGGIVGLCAGTGLGTTCEGRQAGACPTVLSRGAGEDGWVNMGDVRRMRLGGSLALPGMGWSLGADLRRPGQLVEDQQERQEKQERTSWMSGLHVFHPLLISREWLRFFWGFFYRSRSGCEFLEMAREADAESATDSRERGPHSACLCDSEKPGFWTSIRYH